MKTNDYMKKLYQDMQLRGYTEHTQEVYGRVVGKFLNFSGKFVEVLDEHDIIPFFTDSCVLCVSPPNETILHTNFSAGTCGILSP